MGAGKKAAKAIDEYLKNKKSFIELNDIKLAKKFPIKIHDIHGTNIKS